MTQHTQKIILRINPPPDDANCECCGRHVSIVSSLHKDFRERDVLEAFWVCPACYGLEDEWFFRLRAIENKADLQDWVENTPQDEKDIANYIRENEVQNA